VALSLATGIVAAFLLVTLPFVPVNEDSLTGAVLCGFAAGWALLWLLSLRFTDHPQRWAVAPAVFMGVGGLVLVTVGSPASEALGWVWPPTLLLLVIWMLHQTRRDMRSRSGRVQLYLVFTVLALSAVGGTYATVVDATDSTAMPATGRLIDVGGHKLYLNCVGSGSPTVVLEPGAGATSSQLGWIAPAVAASTRVCVYDRAGRGWSESADSPQDGAQIATDLHTLLHRGGVTGPYVLAGHSFGGLYVRIFAAHYPDEVAGLALLDSTASKEPARSVIPSSGSSEEPLGRVPVLMSLSARVGLPRFLGQLDLGSLPPQSRDEARASLAQSSWVSSTVDEYLRGGASAQQAASLRDLADKPLFVVTAGEHPASWMASQDEMLTLSTNSVQQIVVGATHTDVVLEEKYAAATAQAILAVVESVRSDRPLSHNLFPS
jgi:pimeloyl-ACP methyl ester carboxylesterase